MAVKSADRISLEDMREIIAAALVPGDCEHDAEWARPGSCPCHDQGLSCLAMQAAGDRQACQGHVIEVDTPAAHVVTAEILISALEPGPDGTLDAQEAATSILRVIGERLGGEYVLRAHSLARRLADVSEEYEEAHGLAGTSVPADAGQQSWMPRCQYCGDPCKDKRARYCRPAHRQAAYKRRRRDG